VPNYRVLHSKLYPRVIQRKYNVSHVWNLKFSSSHIKKRKKRSTWLAKSVEQATFDLRIMRLNSALGVEILAGSAGRACDS